MNRDRTNTLETNDKNEHIAVVAAANPDGLLEELEKVRLRKSVLAVVIDLTSASGMYPRSRGLEELMENFHVPLILAVNGVIKGWSAGVLLASHICFAEASTTIEFENESQLMPYLKASKRTGCPPLVYSASSASESGIVNAMTQNVDALQAARETAMRISKMAPLAVRACLAAVAGSKRPSDVVMENELRLFSGLFESQDMKRGTQSFLNRTEPHFEGN